ncbi:MAG: thiamine phosphate synthase [Acidobacteriota bacterium]
MVTSLQINYSLYLVTDRNLSLGRPIEDVVLAAVRGGVTCVQLREKECSAGEFLNLALRLKSELKGRGVPLIINDRLDVALAAGADGVHLGQSDIPLQMAKRISAGRLLIGISASSVEDAIRAEAGGADYVGISPVFSTPTKTDTADPQGLDGVRKIRQAVKIPIVGIGGLNASNAGQVIRSGADGVAVVSAIVSAPDPEKAARALLREIREAGKR